MSPSANLHIVRFSCLLVSPPQCSSTHCLSPQSSHYHILLSFFTFHPFLLYAYCLLFLFSTPNCSLPASNEEVQGLVQIKVVVTATKNKRKPVIQDRVSHHVREIAAARLPVKVTPDEIMYLLLGLGMKVLELVHGTVEGR